MSEKSETKNKSDLVELYIQDFPDTPTKSLARLVHSEHPMLFPSIENARHVIRYVRGNVGERDRKKRIDAGKSEFFRKNQEPGYYFGQIPEPISQHESEWGSVEIDIKKALLLFDVHAPFHDKQALEIALQFGLDAGCTDVVIAGDFLDCFSTGYFRRDITVVEYRKELEIGRKLLEIIRNLFPDGNIYFKEGNHEERHQSYLELKSPELLGIPDFKLPEILKVKDLDIQYIGEKRPLVVDKLHIIHGHEFAHSPYNPVNPARGYFLRAKTICIGGHYHQTSEHTEMSLDGKITSVWSAGCLCDLHPRWCPINKWNHGFAVVDTTSTSKRFKVDNYRIIKGEVL
jgi:predicted phosphodiesterase